MRGNLHINWHQVADILDGGAWRPIARSACQLMWTGVVGVAMACDTVSLACSAAIHMQMSVTNKSKTQSSSLLHGQDKRVTNLVQVTCFLYSPPTHPPTPVVYRGDRVVVPGCGRRVVVGGLGRAIDPRTRRANCGRNRTQSAGVYL